MAKSCYLRDSNRQLLPALSTTIFFSSFSFSQFIHRRCDSLRTYLIADSIVIVFLWVSLMHSEKRRKKNAWQFNHSKMLVAINRISSSYRQSFALHSWYFSVVIKFQCTCWSNHFNLRKITAFPITLHWINAHGERASEGDDGRTMHTTYCRFHLTLSLWQDKHLFEFKSTRA